METIYCLAKEECCGCSSCAQKCPKNAITMKENKEGFLYPEIDKNKCIECGLCSKVCPQLKKIKERDQNFPKAYAARNKNKEELFKSSSGGFFSVLANYVIENKGIVFGAAYDDNLNVNHIKITSYEEISFLRSSKYVQSNIKNTYKEAEEALKNDQYVLYTGTPCQIAGLKAYLTKDYKKLITADIICHGVPSQKLFHKYLDFLSEKYGSKVLEYNFRSKEKTGWGEVSKVTTEDGKIRYFEPDFDPYYNSFLGRLTLRENCYQCHYSNYNRVSNFTMGDFWGIEDIHPKFYNVKGNSLILVNDEKAEKILKQIENCVELIETDLDHAANNNKNLKEPSRKPNNREFVYIDIDEKTPKEFMKNNLKCKITIRKIVKKIVPMRIRQIIKKIIRK